MFRIKSTSGLLFFALFMLPIAAAHGQGSEGGQQASVEGMSSGLRRAVSAAMERDARRIDPAGEHDGFATGTVTTRIGTCGDLR